MSINDEDHTGDTFAVGANPACGCTTLDLERSPIFANSCRYGCSCGVTVDVDVWPDGDVTTLGLPADGFHLDRAANAAALDALCPGVSPAEVAAVEATGAPVDWQAAFVSSQRP